MLGEVNDPLILELLEGTVSFFFMKMTSVSSIDHSQLYFKRPCASVVETPFGKAKQNPLARFNQS